MPGCGMLRPVGYPENVLAPEERVVKHLHPHWLTLVLPTVLLVIIVAAASLGIYLIPGGSAQMTLRAIILGLGLILLVAFVVVPFLRWRTTHYVITTHRVMVRRGILTRNGKDIGLSKITDVSYTQTLWDRIISAGTLHVESAGDSPDETLYNIPNSDDVQQLINHLVEQDHDRRMGGTRPPAQQAGYPPQGYPDQSADRYPTQQYPAQQQYPQPIREYPPQQ